MNRNEQDALLKQILGNEELEKVRAITLARGIKAARRRRGWRIASRASAFVAILALFLAISLRSRMQAPVAAPALPVAVSVQPAVAPKLEKIANVSAAEVFALFPDRAIALIGKPGSQRVVFLDAPPPDSE